MRSARSSKHLAVLAQAMTFHCVRNTVLEDWHASGRLSSAEVKAFMKDVTAKLYSTMCMIGDQDFEEVYTSLAAETRLAWDEPKLDRDFIETFRAELLKQASKA